MQMNILNQSPGHPRAFHTPRGPSHHHHHPDACQHLPSVSPPSPASNSLRSSHPSRSASGPSLEPLKSRDAHTDMPVKSAPQAQTRTTVGSISEPCKATGSAGDVQLFQPCSCTTGLGLGLVRSLMELGRFSPLEGGAALLDHPLFSRPEGGDSSTRGVTLAVSVSSAVKLESRQMEQIAKKMRKLTGFKSVRLENTVDPSLIAGFVVSYGVDGEHVIDLSVKGRLAQLEARLESSDQSAAEGWITPGGGALW
uniref:ATP synthase delta chain, chloroplastic n=1 Tax=Anthurium amnicola TaxID=1678845 RepID=A0A1D1YNV2_9ARAE